MRRAAPLPRPGEDSRPVPATDDRALRPAWLALGASLWMAIPGNLALWRELATLPVADGAGRWLLGAALAAMVTAALVLLLSLLAWRWTLKPAIAALLAVSAACSHFMLRYHVVIDAGMVTNALQTDYHEAADLLDWGLAGWLLAGCVLPSLWLWRQPVRAVAWPRQAARNAAMALLAAAAFAAVVLAAYQPLASAMRNHKQLRYQMTPLNALYAAGLALAPLQRTAGPPLPLGTDAHLAAAAGRKPPLLVLVVGETGRSGNFGLNGYGRDTTPGLQRAGAIGFRNAWACGTSTAASVPCMFSHLGREAFLARDQEHENLLDVLLHAGLAVLWIDNQGGCKGVCARVPTISLAGSCGGAECPDGRMTAQLDAQLAALPAGRRARGVVLVLHPMGSHGPAYWKRSPPEAKRFLPECRSDNLQDCSREELVNAYDNSIAYADQELAATIGWLQRQHAYDTALLYVADHGESLGENNLYLHGLPWALAPDVQKHVPWITWLSPAFAARGGIAGDCLRSRADARLTHDHLFHSVLGLLQVETAAYRPALDAYAPCAGAPATVARAATLPAWRTPPPRSPRAGA